MNSTINDCAEQNEELGTRQITLNAHECHSAANYEVHMNRFANLIFVFASLTPAYAAGQVCVRHLDVPEYPPIARAARWEGVADLTITVGSRGQVVHVEGKGLLPILIDQAKENVKSWTFCDPQKNGSSHVYLRYDYRLKGTPVYPSPPAKVVIDLGAAKVVITSPPVEPQP